MEILQIQNAGIFRFNLFNLNTRGTLLSKFEKGISATNDLLRGADNMIYISNTFDPKVHNECKTYGFRFQSTYYHRSGKRLGVIYFPEKEMEYGFEWEGPKLADPTFPVLSDVLSTGYLGNFPATPPIEEATAPGTTLLNAIDLGTNPRACCGTLTHTLDVACAGNEVGQPGNDVYFKFKLEKYCDVWPTLTVNSTGTDFAYTSTLRYKNNINDWVTILNSSSITIDNATFITRVDMPTSGEAEFELVLDANSAGAIGNFELQITAVKQLSRIENGNTITCAGDFNSCCRIAVDFEDTASSPIAQSHHLGNSLDIRLYPNPAKGTVNWEMKNLGDELVSIELFNMLGKQLRRFMTKEHAGSIDLKGIPSGVCTVRIRNQHMTKMVKLVVE